MQRGATHARFKWEPCAEENGAAVNQYWLEINGPVADGFAPSGDVPKCVHEGVGAVDASAFWGGAGDRRGGEGFVSYLPNEDGTHQAPGYAETHK